MEITIKINGQAVPVEVSYEVHEYLNESKRKTEKLSHQKAVSENQQVPRATVFA